MVKLGVEIFFFKIPIGRTVFNFSCKTSGFTGGFSFSWSTFCQFFVIFSCNTSAFCGAGWSFWVKKDIFFHAKLQFLRGWVVFLSKKNTFFWDFLENVEKLKFWLKVPSCEKKSEVSESEKWCVLGPLIFMKLLYVIGGVLT